MATKIVLFFNFPYFYGKSNDLGGNRIGIKKLPDYPHPLVMFLGQKSHIKTRIKWFWLKI